MIEKRYNDDWAKARSRDIVGKMIDEKLLPFKRPRDITVLHFGGIDLAEARQIYLPRGILPRNIVSVEQDANIAQAQRIQNTGVQIVESDMASYLQRQRSLGFDVVSLDYTGPINEDILSSILDIREKQQKNKFVLHLANSIRRDHTSNKIYGYHTLVTDLGETLISNEDRDALMVNRLKKVNDFLDGERRDCKSYSFSRTLLNSFCPIIFPDLMKALRFVCGSEENYELRVRWLQEELRRETRCKELSIDLSNGPSFKPLLGQAMAYTSTFVSNAFRGTLEPFFIKCPEAVLSHCSREMLGSISPGKKFYVTEASRYSYTSESGTPMIGDVVLLEHPAKLQDIAKATLNAFGYPRGIQYRNIAEVNKHLGALLRESMDFWAFTEGSRDKDPYSEISLHNRTFLGNSSRPVLTKRRFIQELESGKTVDDIRAQYRGWDKKPLAQWKAHFTMGTYTSQTMAEEDVEDSDLEKISKEQAYELLESGIPVKEIHEAYPTSFTVGQLGAYQAWITMRKRNQNEIPAEVTCK